MQDVLAKIIMVLGICGTVLPALAPLVHLDPGGVVTVVSAMGGLVTAVGGLFHSAPGSTAAAPKAGA